MFQNDFEKKDFFFQHFILKIDLKLIIYELLDKEVL